MELSHGICGTGGGWRAACSAFTYSPTTTPTCPSCLPVISPASSPCPASPNCTHPQYLGLLCYYSVACGMHTYKHKAGEVVCLQTGPCLFAFGDICAGLGEGTYPCPLPTPPPYPTPTGFPKCPAPILSLILWVGEAGDWISGRAGEAPPWQ